MILSTDCLCFVVCKKNAFAPHGRCVLHAIVQVREIEVNVCSII